MERKCPILYVEGEEGEKECSIPFVYREKGEKVFDSVCVELKDRIDGLSRFRRR